MENTDAPVGVSHPSSSMLRMDDLFHELEVNSAWKVVSTPNFAMWSHKHNCERCSHYLEHLLLGACAGELQAHPAELEQWLDHVWPTTMDDIHKAVTQPLQERLDVAGDFCNIKDDEIAQLQLVNVDLHEDLAVEQRAQCQVEDRLDRLKGKQREESEASVGHPSSHKGRRRSPRRHPPSRQSICQLRFLKGWLHPHLKSPRTVKGHRAYMTP